MRRQHLTQLIGTFVVAAALVGLPAMALAGISGSEHDLSGAAYTTEICNVCHTPHNADTDVADAPLWDHEVTVQGYTVYSSTTLNATVGQPDGVSKLCLSCHDGSVALDSFAGATGTTTISGNALVGSDLANDHPISFVYNTALSTADGGLFDPSAAGLGPDGGTIDAEMLFSSNVECASCHDVHDADDNTYLLTVNNADSALCLTCHDK
jgi:predicted CXXCH cytochrome family protein